jgi:hypothetical protein
MWQWSVVAAAALALAAPQDRKVEEALVAFGKAMAGAEAQRIEAVKTLSGLPNEKVYIELGRALKDSSDAVRAGALEVLGEYDHPNVGRILADAVKPNMDRKKVLAALVKAIAKVNWDACHQAISEPLLLATQGGRKAAGDQEYSDIAWEYLENVEKNGAVYAIEGLYKLLWKIEEGRQYGFRAPTDDYENRIRKILKMITGVEKPKSKDYEQYWKSNKTRILTGCTYVMWCPQTGKRWERKGMDAKSYCPHHSDKNSGAADGSVPALTRAN